MATKEDGEVEKNFQVSINCLTCAEVEKTTLAIKYCLECQSHMCEECIQHHNKFAALRKHQLVEVTDAPLKEEENDQSKADTGVECHLHYGQNIDSYCKDHDEVCCSVCLTIKHRSCKQIQNIQTEEEALKESKEFTAQALEKCLKYANDEKGDRNINLATLHEEQSKSLADIDAIEERLIQKIKTLANASRKNLRVSHAKHEHAMESDVKELDTVMSGLKESLNKLEKRDRNERAAFVSIKNCQKTSAELKQVVDNLSEKWLHVDLRFQFNDKILPEGATALGHVIEEAKNDKTYILPCKSEGNISGQTDEKTCEISGICQLSDETFVIIDRSNANLKRLTDTLDVTDYITLDMSPICMCVTGPQEVAVCMCVTGPQEVATAQQERNLIQFISADNKFTLGPSFSVDSGICTAINYDCKEQSLYLSCINVTDKDKQILVYNREGTMLKVYNTELKPRKKQLLSLVSAFHHFKINLDQILLGTNTITFFDSKEGLVVLDKTAEAKDQITRKENLQSYRCLCFLPGYKMLGESFNPFPGLGKNYQGFMTLLSFDGKTIKTLKMENPIKMLTAIYNKQKSTLLVAGESCEIREYKLPLKLLKLLE